jgi:hypothetical protein
MEYEICAETESRPDTVLPAESARPVRSVAPVANRDEVWARRAEQRGILIPEEEF